MTDDDRFAIGRIGVWTGALDFVPASRAQELAVEIEGLGYAAIWVPEVAGRDPFVHCALLLSATERIVSATGIANIWARDAVTMAGAAKAVTEAFPERFLLGLGVSHHTLVEDLRGHTYAKPLSAMRTYLAAMDEAPYTSARPTTPVRRVLAALGPRMLELAAARADGAHSYFVTPEHTAVARAALGHGLLCVEQAIVLETDPEAARRIARAHMATYLRLPNYANNVRRLGFGEGDLAEGGSDRLVDAIVAWGDVDTVTSRVGAQLAAGADHVCVQALDEKSRRVPVEQWRRLGPALAELA
ncbi:MAG TPA: LLM class F420-dependent oxidoreductase [Acidimicrobiales bacterium]|jgi:probable F420-dependent oxidoreductase|nr:LLM class F420-dependent oxidoreductase [Acidimicrobiales bacterium]